MMLNIRKSTLCLLSAIILIAACDKKVQSIVPSISNESLTTIELKLVNNANQADSVAAIIKVDAITGELTDSSKATLNLKANSVYCSSVVLLDTTQSPVLNVSNEMKERQNYHLLFYQPTPISADKLIIGTTSPYIPSTETSSTGPYLNLSISRTDHDTNNPPLEVGLTASFTTGAASNGRLNFVVRHQPNAKNGSFEPGSSDIDVNFAVTIY